MTTDTPPVARLSRDEHGVALHVNDEWWEDVKGEYLGFESLKDRFRNDEADERLVGYEPDEGVEGLVENPPDNWIEGVFSGDILIGLITRLVAEQSLVSLTEEEYCEIGALLDDELYKTAIMRESAFLEEFLAVQCMMELRRRKLDDMSNKDVGLVEQMGHRDRIRLARLLRVLDEPQHGYLQEMAERRNDIAHNPWSSFDDEKTREVRTAAIKVQEVLAELIDEMDSKVYPAGKED